MGVSNSTAMVDTSACGITRPAWPTMIIPADTAETALDRAARHARGAWRIHGAAGQPGALPAVQPTTTPAPSVASLSHELPSSGCAVLDELMMAVSSHSYEGGFVYGRVRLGMTAVREGATQGGVRLGR